MSTNTAAGVKWNLSEFYESPQDPRIVSDLEQTNSLAQHFETTYKPLLEKLSSDNASSFPLKQLMEDYETMLVTVTKLAVYSHLLFAEKTDSPERGAFMQKTQSALTEIQSHTIFFSTIWNKLDESIVQTVLSPEEVQKYRHYLENMRIYAPHTLQENEERIMALKSNTSGRAFSRLFDEIVNNIEFEIELNGQAKKMSEAEILALLHSPKREERRLASEGLGAGLQKNTHLLCYIFNMTLADHRTNMQIRGYEHPMHSRNLANEASMEQITSLIDTVKGAYPIAQRYYHLKRKLMRLDDFYDYDRYAPLKQTPAEISFKECQSIVIGGYYDFCEQAGKIAEKFFLNKWIDAELRPGKQGGGFCCSTTPDMHPFILVNYTGSLRDVMTVAHEVGHGIHQYLAAERVGLLESHAPLTLAETASVFGEMLIFESLLKKCQDPGQKLDLICGKIDDNFATVYRQIAMTDFELQSHLAYAAEGEMSEEKINQIWMNCNRAFYGDAVTLSESYNHGWKYIPHFIHSPFYCYAYAFAQLFVLTLYRNYKQEGDPFIAKYLNLLALGGSKKPEEMAQTMNLNISDKHFWQGGIELLEELVIQAEELTAKV